MEEMLQNFTSSGMTDIAFLIVNSKKERSQKLLPQLEARVSFPVYQETEREEVWSVLGGGKDDMFVYDRCGRLVAYIPFPLSLLDNDRSLVSNFILYAYHIDPCEGVKPCSETDTELQDTGADFLNNTLEENYDQQNLSSRINEVDSENINELWLATNETTELNINSTFHIDHSSEHTSYFETQNNTVFQGIQNSTWETQNLDQNNTADTNLSPTHISDTSVGQNRSSDYNQSKFSDTKDINDLLPDTKPTDTTPKRICVAEDEKVCKQWSKRQLKRIQRCCAHADGKLEDANSRYENTCKSFQKKRCKKLRTVIKCCLKIYVPDENDDEAPSTAGDERIDSVEVESHNKHAENAMDKVS